MKKVGLVVCSTLLYLSSLLFINVVKKMCRKAHEGKPCKALQIRIQRELYKAYMHIEIASVLIWDRESVYMIETQILMH